ncbi:ankyrin repeat domain-containing protein 7-like, partial [Acomys russatus]|uniref:ankyrin repeat domain-containing protein 7-like n=1 Tax=Acomys russatus TaxID=60746 RepID=UPI0021E26E13
MDYDAETSTAQNPARWYTHLCCGRLSNKKKKLRLRLIGYDPVGLLQRAASMGDLDAVEQLINSSQCHVDECDRRNRTSLHYACAHNHVDVVTLLLQYNPSINIQDDEGCTPLIKAAQRDNLECMCVLLQQGADPHLKDFSGHAALHHAVLRGNIATVEKLLEFNADIDAKTEYGLTPFQLAICENDYQMVDFLASKAAIAHRVADPNSKGTQAEDLEEKHVRFSKGDPWNLLAQAIAVSLLLSHCERSKTKKTTKIHTENIIPDQYRMTQEVNNGDGYGGHGVVTVGTKGANIFDMQ